MYVKRDHLGKAEICDGDAPTSKCLRGDPTPSLFNYDQSDPLYWPGLLETKTWREIHRRADKGDGYAKKALQELVDKGTDAQMTKKYGKP